MKSVHYLVYWKLVHWHSPCSWKEHSSEYSALFRNLRPLNALFDQSERSFETIQYWSSFLRAPFLLLQFSPLQSLVPSPRLIYLTHVKSLCGSRCPCVQQMCACEETVLSASHCLPVRMLLKHTKSLALLNSPLCSWLLKLTMTC